MIPSPVEQYIWSAARWILNLADVGQSGRIWPRVLEKIPMHFLHCIHPASTFKWKEASSCKPDLDNHLKKTKCHICWEAWPHLLNKSISQKQQNFPEAQQTPAIESVTGADCKLSYRVAVIPNSATCIGCKVGHHMVSLALPHCLGFRHSHQPESCTSWYCICENLKKKKSSCQTLSCGSIVAHCCYKRT